MTPVRKTGLEEAADVGKWGMAHEGWGILSVDQIKAPKDGAISIGPFGSRMKSDRYVDSGIPVIRGDNLSDSQKISGDFVFVSPETADELHSSNVFPGDLVFPHRGAIGRVGIVSLSHHDRYVISTSLMKLTCDKRIVNPLFVFYFFRSPQGRHELLKNASTVGTPGIGQPLTSLKAILIPIPPIGEQHAIAQILGALDDKIEVNRRMNEVLEAMARAIFKSWFVDFDPVRAKAEGRDPGLPPELAALFPSKTDDGDIPAGWKPLSLSALANLNPESWTRTTAPRQIRYVDLSNTKWGSIEEVQEFARVDAPSRAQRILRPGDTIVGTVRPGNGSFALVDEDGMTGSTGFAVLRPKWPSCREFVYLAATAPENIERLAHLADGAAYPAVRSDVVAATEVLEPSASVLKGFSAHVAPMMDRIAASRRESRTLAAIRNLLLPKLISGELRVKEAERIAEAAS